MLSTEQIQSILDEITADPRVQTVLVAGSYAYGHPREDSDLDVRCITNDGSDFADTNCIRFNTVVEIFFNPPEKILAYFEEDQLSNDADCISAWDQGILFYDVNGVGQQLKEKAHDIFMKGPYHGVWKKSPKHNVL